MEIISRSKAAQQGLKRYYTSSLCKHGHDSPRYVCNAKCVACDQKEDIHVKRNNTYLKRFAQITMSRRK